MRKLAGYLTEKFGRGFSLATLKNARQFYQIHMPTIQQAHPSLNLENKKKRP